MPFYLFVAFGTGLPALCIAARVYEEAIAVGYAWGFAGLYLAIPLLLDEEDSRPNKWLHPLAFLLVFGTSGPFPPVMDGCGGFAEPVASCQARYLQTKLLVAEYLAVSNPVILACALQLFLNYQRFDDPFRLWGRESYLLCGNDCVRQESCGSGLRWCECHLLSDCGDASVANSFEE
jgi:hypothetical protein